MYLRGTLYLFISAITIFFSTAYSQTDSAANVAQVKTDTAHRTFALIMGISTYKFIRPLSYADSDAELFRDFLKSPGGGKLSDENIFCLLNEEAKAANFWVKGMSWLRSKDLRQGDRLYIYMAGHGDAINQDEYFFLTYDCNPAGDKNNYIVTGSVQLYNLKSRIGAMSRKGVDVILIMDACRTNELPGGTDGQNILNSAISEKNAGEIIMLATGAGQESLEDASIGTGHGLFTYYLVDGLTGMADSKINPDNNITLSELKEYVDTNVPSIAEEKFKRKQDPFICCDDQNNEALVKVDSVFFKQWELAKQLKSTSGTQMARNVASRGGINGLLADTSLLPLYTKFNTALKKLDLTGSDSSAEYFYKQMELLQPGNSITQMARASLVAEIINFGQTKINLYLQGQDAVAIQRIRSQIDESETPDEVNTTLNRIEKVAGKEFAATGNLLEKAIALLNSDEEPLLNSLLGKMYFFKARGYFENNGRYDGFDEAMDYAYRSYHIDTTAAYSLNTISSLQLQNNKPDSAVFFAKKAIEYARNWRYPYLNAAYAYGKMNMKDSAILYYSKAIEVDPKNADARVDLGKYYYTLFMKDSAKEHYNQALRLDPNNIFALNNLGWIYKDEGDFVQARDHFKKCIELQPEYFNSYNGLSKTFIEMKKYDSARIYYEKALQNYPDKLLISNYLGNFYTIIKQYDSAKVYYEKALQYDPTDYSTFLNLAKLFRNISEYDSAKRYYSTAIQLNPGNAVTYNQLGLLYKELKQFDSARYYMVVASSLDPDYVPVLNNIGLSFLEARQYDSARSFFQQAILKQPNNAFLYNNLGMVFNEEQKNDSANFYFQKAITHDPDNLSAYINMGLLFRKMRNYDSAKVYFLQGLKRKPSSTLALNNLVTIFRINNQADSVRYYYQQLMKDDPGNAAMISNMGVLFSSMQKTDSAIVIYKQALAADSTFALAWNNLGTAYNDLALYDTAILFYQKAIHYDPSYTRAYFNMGMAYYNQQMYDTAILYIQKAAAMEPDVSFHYYYLACAYALKEEPGESIKNIRRALEKGYNNKYNLLNDLDLASVRNLPQFKELIKKFFPAKK
jgi:tetratricopeptide (TPR) repeat protein